ncbi:glycosyltransferase family 2 protein [Streptomyces sp. NBC_00103]|uniref:glycosyltransferase n=1 Tax=Streptomyces sp. NBC_00103 TaxID=2975653 RepID=UPI00225A03C4|nr:glycosyltransferase [Streptomyces sp. NBC_00103]MCX5368701.1 glycosyltransferase [Streptomyces sp. NBC_00103]
MYRAARAQQEIQRFLDIEPVQVAELELDDGGVLRPGPGSPPVTHGEVFVLVRRGGRPIGALLGSVPEGADPKTVLMDLATREQAPGPPSTGPGQGATPATTARATTAQAFIARAETAPNAKAPTTTPSAAAVPTATPSTTAVPTATAQAAGVPAPAAPAPAAAVPFTTVVVATRERAEKLALALDSLLAQDHPDFEIVVVDNAPLTDATRDLVERKYAERVRYVTEPAPGLAVAHNKGVETAHGEVIAFTDDDVVADPRWLTELTAPFTADPGLGCATGLILPARLRTPSQVLLESHGGFAKGFTARTYDPQDPPADEPLFPFTAGRFGSGANMAFRTEVLRAAGGFDPATGAGTLARGGDDLYGFVRVLAGGHRLHYTPLALVWHHHRETWRDLETQAYGYGAGLTAYLTAILVNRPGLLPAFLARLPRGLAHARTLTASREAEPAADGAPGGHDARTHAWPARLSRLQRRGMLYGPVGYLRARRALRGAAR